MNSMSKYYKDDCDPCKKDNNEEKSCQTIVKCGCPSSTTFPLISIGDSLTVASLNLDTSGLKNPCVKLEFATNLISVAAITGTFRFQVFKQCSNQLNPVPVGPSWIFGPVAIGSDTFSFFVCDCDSCFDKCCTYTVVATTTVAGGTININNATLGAIAACGSTCGN